MDDQDKKRYRNSIDTFSLHEADSISLSAEEVAEGEAGFIDILSRLSTDKQRFIALALYHGFSKIEIARILNVTKFDIYHLTRNIQIKLAVYRIRHKRTS